MTALMKKSSLRRMFSTTLPLCPSSFALELIPFNISVISRPSGSRLWLELGVALHDLTLGSAVGPKRTWSLGSGVLEMLEELRTGKSVSITGLIQEAIKI
jgi:hypothetical protein